MFNLKRFCAVLSAAALISLTPLQAAFAHSSSTLLKQGMKNSEVSQLQQDLKSLGFFNENTTGYYGSITKSSVIKFQKYYGLQADGIAGPQTLSQLNSTSGRTANTATTQTTSENVSRGSEIQLLPWFGSVDKVYGIGDVATVIDIQTGLSMQVKRTYGYNHADVETLTTKETETLKKAAGGSWNWTRRPVIVEINGYRIAGSITAMPHAGRDDKPANSYISDRSGGYGYGVNLDSIKGNNMDGHFDIHFLGSRTHSSNKVNQAHQDAIMKAYKSGR